MECVDGVRARRICHDTFDVRRPDVFNLVTLQTYHSHVREAGRRIARTQVCNAYFTAHTSDAVTTK